MRGCTGTTILSIAAAFGRGTAQNMRLATVLKSGRLPERRLTWPNPSSFAMQTAGRQIAPVATPQPDNWAENNHAVANAAKKNRRKWIFKSRLRPGCPGCDSNGLRRKTPCHDTSESATICWLEWSAGVMARGAKRDRAASELRVPRGNRRAGCCRDLTSPIS